MKVYFKKSAWKRDTKLPQNPSIFLVASWRNIMEKGHISFVIIKLGIRIFIILKK